MPDFVRWGVIFAFLMLFFGILRAAASAPARWSGADADSASVVFEHGVFVRKWCLWLFGLLPTVGLLVIAVMVLVEGGEEPWVFPALVGLVVFFLFATWILRMEGRQQVVVDPEGLRQANVAEAPKIAWDDVKAVRFSWFWNAILIRGGLNTRIRASVFFRGFDLLAEIVRAKVPPERIGEALTKADRFRGRNPKRETPMDLQVPEGFDIRSRAWETPRRDAQ